MSRVDQFIPKQYVGKPTDFAESRSFISLSEAHRAFLSATSRLLNVNDWQKFTGPGSASFSLTDSTGRSVVRDAEEGDLIAIDLPGPGPKAGKGVEWVHVECILSGGSEKETEEFMLMRARPCRDPRSQTGDVAHFFDEGATSTFIVSRQGIRVSARVHGRNERPNQRAGIWDRIRNTLIALVAREGASGVQWLRLVQGLME